MKRVAYQGIAGAFSHTACQNLLPDCQPLPFETFDAACAALHADQVELALLPIQNKITGIVQPAHDAIHKFNFFVLKDNWQPIVQCLLVKKDSALGDIKNVTSHYQALAQCSGYITHHKLNATEFFDTAGAAAWLAREGTRLDSAIASPLASEIYGLNILAYNIADDKDNETQFVLLTKTVRTDPACTWQDFLTRQNNL